jgi:hypothetical protein
LREIEGAGWRADRIGGLSDRVDEIIDARNDSAFANADLRQPSNEASKRILFGLVWRFEAKFEAEVVAES